MQIIFWASARKLLKELEARSSQLASPGRFFFCMLRFLIRRVPDLNYLRKLGF